MQLEVIKESKILSFIFLSFHAVVHELVIYFVFTVPNTEMAVGASKTYSLSSTSQNTERGRLNKKKQTKNSSRHLPRLFLKCSGICGLLGKEKMLSMGVFTLHMTD